MKGWKQTAAAMLLVLVSGTAMSGATYTASSTNPNGLFTAAGDFLVHATLTDPGSPLRGTVNLTASASDTGGATIADVTFQRSPAGAGTWTNACAPDAAPPYTCSLNTAALSDGPYDLRAVATNSFGSTRISTVTGRHVDNGLPSVTISDPGAWFGGTITLASTTSDPAGGTGVASVRYEYKTTAGSTWTTACTGATAPFSCSFATTGLTTGTNYDFRAVAADGATNATTSVAVTSRRPDNTAPTAALTDPGTPLDGTITLAGTATDANSGVAIARMQVSPAGAGAWTDACTDTVSAYSCTWNTTTVADGLYDMRLQATDVAGNVTNSTVRANRRIDNTTPVVTLSDPGPYLRGTGTLYATATDNGGSGFPDVDFQYRIGAGAWTTFCSDVSSPYSCPVDSTAGADGPYDFRAIATDGSGLVGISQAFTITFDNTLPSATTTDPGTPLSGTVTVNASASDATSGVASVLVETRPAGGAWSAVCTDTVSPYSCQLDTTTKADGLHELRTTVTDGAGNVRTSTAVTNRRIDNNAPTGVTVNDPGAWIAGTETLGGTASDGAGSGVTSLTVQYAPAGTSTWSTACSDAVSPYSCTFDTTALTNGALYDFRSVAVDGAGFSTTSSVVSGRRVDNGAPTGVSMTDPGTPLTGTVAFAGGASDALSGVATVRYQFWNGAAWADLCTASSAPWSCSGSTAVAADGLRDVRALATDVAGNTAASASIANRQFDNTDPTITMTDPGANIRGSVSFAATAADGAGSGVVSVSIQRSPAGAGTWTEVCLDLATPFACAPFDTTTLTDGLYDFRAVATDGVGRTRTSTTVGNRRVDNTAPATAITAPAGPLRMTAALSATGTDTGGSGVATVRFQRSPAGADTWTDICTDATSAYTCNWNTTGVADGLYDLRSFATDNAGNTTASVVAAGRAVDNTDPTATDVETADPGGLNGIMESGDTMTLTYSETIAPGSIIAGWDGSGSQSVTVRVNNNGSNDRVLVYNAGNSARLPLTGANGVTLGAEHITANMTWSGTLTTTGSTFTVTLGAITGGSIIGTATGNAGLTWNPDAGALDLAGNGASTTARPEGGTADPNF